MKGIGKTPNKNRKDQGLTTPEKVFWNQNTSQENLLAIIDNLPCGVVVTESILGDALYVNKALSDMCGYSILEIPTAEKAYEILGKGNNVPQADIDAARKKLLEEGHVTSIRQTTCKDGQEKTIELRAVKLPDGKIVSIWTDITAQERAYAEIKKREAMFRAFFEDCSDPVFFMKGGHIMDCNTAALKALEFPKKQMLVNTRLSALSFADSLKAGNQTNIDDLISEATKNENNRQFEWIFKKQSGTPYHAEARISPVSLGTKNIWYLMLRDISLWKDTEKELLYTQDKLEEHIEKRTAELESVNRQLKEEIRRRKMTEKMLEDSRADLRKLSEHLQRAREEERTSIARDVHDELGQTLSVLKIDSAFLKTNINDNKGAIIKRLKAMEQQIDTSISSVREICTKLRPPILEDFGLCACIEWFIRDLEKRSGICCFVDLDEDFPSSNKALSLMLFRVLQESVTNILRHAKASRIDISLEVKNRQAILTVKDNGIGLTEKQAASQPCFGIIGIRERVRFWGGGSSFSGQPGKGTCVSVCVPFKDPGENKDSQFPGTDKTIEME